MSLYPVPEVNGFYGHADKYWNDDGSATDKGAAAAAKVQPTIDEMVKLGTYSSVITDWVIQ